MIQYKKGVEAAWDQNTYLGRLKHFQALSNQRNWFFLEEDLENYKKIVEDFDNGNTQNLTNEQIWKAKYIVLGNFHCQTQELLPRLFRTSGYCLLNAPIIFALSIIPPTPMNQMFFQSVNQLFNFSYNFCNGNKSNEYKNSELAFSVSMAVLSAIGGSVGTLKLIKILKVSPSIKNIMNKFAPFIGVGVANEANLFFSRIQDFSKGIKIYNAETGEAIEDYNSVNAAKIAFYQTAVSRIVIPIPVFSLPQFWIAGLSALKLTPKNFIIKNFINTCVGALSLYAGLTYALAIYPQNVVVNADQLEPYFQQLTDKNGNKIEKYSFNKGL